MLQINKPVTKPIAARAYTIPALFAYKLSCRNYPPDTCILVNGRAKSQHTQQRAFPFARACYPGVPREIGPQSIAPGLAQAGGFRPESSAQASLVPRAT